MDLVSLGLVLDIIGVILLFFFGLPSRVTRKPDNAMLWPKVEEEEKQREKKFRLYSTMSHIGLLLLIVGFTLQLVGNFCGTS